MPLAPAVPRNHAKTGPHLGPAVSFWTGVRIPRSGPAVAPHETRLAAAPVSPAARAASSSGEREREGGSRHVPLKRGRVPGRLAAWPPGRLAAWPPGRLAAWPPGRPACERGRGGARALRSEGGRASRAREPGPDWARSRAWLRREFAQGSRCAGDGARSDRNCNRKATVVVVVVVIAIVIVIALVIVAVIATGAATATVTVKVVCLVCESVGLLVCWSARRRVAVGSRQPKVFC